MNNTTVPVFDPNRGFRVWHMREIFKGPGIGKYVPNIDDAVWDWTTGLWRVISVDPTTGLSELVGYKPPKESDGVTDSDVLLGVAIGTQAETFRVYLDTSHIPHSLAVDSRLNIYGTTATSMKLFKGTNISDSSNVISAMYDQGGTFLGENIPLELVAMPDHHNIAVKAPMVASTLVQMQDGEVVTGIVYDDSSNAISIVKLLVKNTAFIRTTDAAKKFITSIHLKSPFMSDTEERLLQFPVNMPVRGLPMMGVVTYSDGSTIELPVDGNKFSLYGIDHFVSTIVGQRLPIVLTYKLSENEFCYGATPGHNKHISEAYQATTTEFELSYNVKLFAYPNWVDDISGYVLDFYLYSLDRREVRKVTSLVNLSSMSPPFNGNQYGTKQRLSFTLDMEKVDHTYPKFKHLQTVEISLVAPGDQNTTNWLVGFSPNQEPMFGHGLQVEGTFVDTDNWKFNLRNGFNSREAWLNKVYYDTKPLHNPDVELEAPAPNMFTLVTRLRRYTFDISQWNSDLTVINDLEEGQNVYIEFFYRTSETDLQLGVTAIPFHQKTAP